MPRKRPAPLSMQVVLRAASGRNPADGTPITSENLDQFLPDAEAARAVRERFRQASFEVGELVGTSFSITAPASTFEQVLGVRVSGQQGKLRVMGKDGSLGADLPLADLPEALTQGVAAITLPEPPDFGPTSY